MLSSHDKDRSHDFANSQSWWLIAATTLRHRQVPSFSVLRVTSVELLAQAKMTVAYLFQNLPTSS